MALKGRNRRRPPVNARGMSIKDTPKSLPKTQTKSSPVKTKPSNVSTKVMDKHLPAKTKGKAVAKTPLKRGVKNMGNAKVVPKKAITAAKNVGKTNPLIAVGAGVVGNSISRNANLISTGKLSNPMARFGDKAIYGDRLNKIKHTQMPLPKSNPLLSTKANNKAVKNINPAAGNMAGKVIKPKVTAPTKKSTTSPKKTATSNYTPQVTEGTTLMNKRFKSGWKNPTKAPKGTPIKKKPVNNTVDWLMNGDW